MSIAPHTTQGTDQSFGDTLKELDFKLAVFLNNCIT